ncbi:MAG: hypothetical protein ACRD21_06175, partial [Vicinamibacteria bacterium]
MTAISRILGAALVVGALSGSTAWADPPANVVGTWDILLENDPETLVITNQGGAGAPGASQCRFIMGTIGIAPVRGYYCPDNGRIHFLHNNLSNGKTVRDFTGVVSEDPSSGAMHMAGTFNVEYATFGDFGEYPFS